METGRPEGRKKKPRSSIQNFRDAEFDQTKDVFLQDIAMHVTRHTKSSNVLIPVVLLLLEGIEEQVNAPSQIGCRKAKGLK